MRIQRLGRIPYDEAWRLQLELVEARAADKIPDTLLVLEHDPVFTLGRKSPEFKAETAPQSIFNVSVKVVERGGEATFHGPGQLVVYPILQLSADHGPKFLLRLLEESIIDTLNQLELMGAHWIEGKTGVWLETTKGLRKIASLGIAVRKGISYHGLALNLSTDLTYFQKIQPCGFAPEVMTTFLAETGRSPLPEQVGEILCGNISERFAGSQK